MAVIVDKVFMNIYSNNQCNGERDNNFFELKPVEPSASTMIYIVFKMFSVVPNSLGPGWPRKARREILL